MGAGGVAPRPQHEKWVYGRGRQTLSGVWLRHSRIVIIFQTFFFLHKMVYTKRYKRNYRKKSYRKKKSSGTNWGSVAKTALKTAKWVAGLVNAEYKYFDVSPSLPIASTYNGYITGPLCAPPQGTDVESRTGDSIKMVNMTLRMIINYNGANYENIRVIIVHDKENSIVNVSDFLDITGTSMAILSPKIK